MSHHISKTMKVTKVFNMMLLAALAAVSVQCTNAKSNDANESNDKNENVKTEAKIDMEKYKNYKSPNPEGMQKVVAAVKDCHYYFIATADGNQPQVRPFSSFDIYEGRSAEGRLQGKNVYILTGHKKNVGRQIDKNPKVAIAAFNGKTLVRITATLVEAKDRETRAAIIEKNPMFANDYTPDDDNTAVYFLADATAKLGQETINF